jgi:hypothetical protein
MRTARQFDEGDFLVRIFGVIAHRDQLLENWRPHDRLGVVMHELFGAVGASRLIQLAITTFYDAKPSRREGFPVPGGAPYD